MELIKICPDCECEYYAHIEKCADCGTLLISPEENARLQEEKKQCMQKALEDQIVIREGDLKWMDELSGILIDAGIPCRVHTDSGCQKGCCGNVCRLMVSSQDAARANERIEEYFSEIHPEVRTAQELLSQGKCPACGSPVGQDAVECPDCGLTLLIAE